MKKITTAFLMLVFLTGFSLTSDSGGLQLIDEKIIAIDNPDWWDGVVVEKPEKLDTKQKIKEQILRIERKIDGVTPDEVDEKVWTRMQTKSYVYLARTYRSLFGTRGLLYFRVGEGYRKLEDYKRARNAYLTARKYLKKSGEELKSIRKKNEKRIKEVKKQLDDERKIKKKRDVKNPDP